MSSALMDNPASVVWPRLPIARLRNAQAALLTLALHGVVLALLLANWPVEKPAAPSISTISMQLLSLPPPAPPVPVEVPDDLVALASQERELWAHQNGKGRFNHNSQKDLKFIEFHCQKFTGVDGSPFKGKHRNPPPSQLGDPEIQDK